MDYIAEIRPKRKALFRGLGFDIPPMYPCYLYHEVLDPVLVKDEEEEELYRSKGYDSFTSGMLANKTMVNWHWDLEDLSAKQLAVFAKDEYDVDLPVEAGQLVLYKAICELSRAAPNNVNRLVFMAQVFEMKLTETVNEIGRMITPGALGVEIENEEFEVIV
jgi:hypothetical protein